MLQRGHFDNKKKGQENQLVLSQRRLNATVEIVIDEILGDSKAGKNEVKNIC